MPTFDEVEARLSPPEDAVTLCLAGGLVAELHDLQRRLASAPALSASLAERSPVSVIEEQIADVRERMAAAVVTFRLRRIHLSMWPSVYASRPVRMDDETDDSWTGRWFDWLADMVSRTCYDPVMTPQQVSTLVDGLNAAQWDELSEAAWAVNAGAVSVPFSAAASETTRTSGPKSRRRQTSASHTANGSAPHLSASPPTSTTQGS